MFTVEYSSSAGYILSMYITCRKSEGYKPNFRDVRPMIRDLLEEGYSRKELIAYILSEQYSRSSAYRIHSEECFPTHDTQKVISLLEILSKVDCFD